MKTTTKKSKIKIGDCAYDGIYFTASDFGVVKEIRSDGWVILNYEVSVGTGIAIPQNKIIKIN